MEFSAIPPGLVGGHCIGVDPYYLTHKAQEAGYHPEVILAGRRINDGMGRYVADQVARLMMKRGFPVVGSRILVMGLAFKENCPDIRNSKAIDIVLELKQFNALVDVWDPWVSPETLQEGGGFRMAQFSCRLLASMTRWSWRSGHREFIEGGVAGVQALGTDGAVLYDVKGIFGKDETDGRL